MSKRSKRESIRIRNFEVRAIICAIAVLTFIVLLIRGYNFAHKSKLDSPTVEKSSILHFNEEYYVNVYNHKTDSVMKLGLEEYIFGVTAAEMPALYEPEALCAQAIAARTFTIRHMNDIVGSDAEHCSHDGVSVCTDSSCCQSWASSESLRTRWGNSFDKYFRRIYSAVLSTQGLFVAYDNQPIQALYHSSSGGKTEDSVNVYSFYVPYLVSVDSPGEENSSGYSKTESMSYDAILSAFKKEYPDADLTIYDVKNIKINSRFPSGRVESVSVGSVTCSGRDVRKILDLRSSNFTIKFGEHEATITAKGYGHGVGMSQSGANAMAKKGADYRKILTHYYSGTEIISIKDFITDSHS